MKNIVYKIDDKLRINEYKNKLLTIKIKGNIIRSREVTILLSRIHVDDMEVKENILIKLTRNGNNIINMIKNIIGINNINVTLTIKL